MTPIEEKLFRQMAATIAMLLNVTGSDDRDFMAAVRAYDEDPEGSECFRPEQYVTLDPEYTYEWKMEHESKKWLDGLSLNGWRKVYNQDGDVVKSRGCTLMRRKTCEWPTSSGKQ